MLSSSTNYLFAFLVAFHIIRIIHLPTICVTFVSNLSMRNVFWDWYPYLIARTKQNWTTLWCLHLTSWYIWRKYALKKNTLYISPVSKNVFLFIIGKTIRNYCIPFKTTVLSSFSLCTGLQDDRIIHLSTIVTQM